MRLHWPPCAAMLTLPVFIHYLRRAQVVDTDALEQNRSPAILGEVDGDPVVVRGDGQVVETGYGECVEIDDVFAIGEVG